MPALQKSEDFSLLVAFLLATFSWFFRGFFVALFCLEKQCSGLFRYFFVAFSWLFRGARFGQILRVLALEQSSEKGACLGRGEAFGYPLPVCPPERPRPLAHYRHARHQSIPLRGARRQMLIASLSFFSLVFLKAPRKTSKTPRIFLTLHNQGRKNHDSHRRDRI